jgi:hypothetical protein
MEDISQQVDNAITAWIKCVIVNITWKIIQGKWTQILGLNEVGYSEIYMEDISQQVATAFAAWMKCFKVSNI